MSSALPIFFLAGTLLLSIPGYVFGFGFMHRRKPVHPCEAVSGVRLKCVDGRNGRSSHKDTQREIFVPVNELEVVLVIGEQCRPDPARAQRNEDVVQKGREL